MCAAPIWDIFTRPLYRLTGMGLGTHQGTCQVVSNNPKEGCVGPITAKSRMPTTT
jgi:hypothetical protein